MPKYTHKATCTSSGERISNPLHIDDKPYDLMEYKIYRERHGGSQYLIDELKEFKKVMHAFEVGASIS